jgi:peptide/nickel transport system substrate-binding protein
MPHSLRSKTYRVALVATLAALFAAGLGLSRVSSDASAKSIAAASKTATPVRGGNLTIGFDLNVQNCLDPNQDFGLEQRDLARNFVDSLTDQNPTTGAIIPWLATSWSVNKNSTVFTFKLRHGVTFSDGEKFNAAAVKTAYDNLYKLGPLSELGVTYMAGYKSTTVVNNYEVKVAFDAPNAQFLQATATTVLGILSPKSYAYTPAERCLGKFWGSGPFILQSYTPGVSAELVRRPGYAWASSIESNQGNAYLSSITAKWITEDSVLIGSLDSGQLNLAWPRVALTPANRSLVTQAGGSIFSRPYPGITDMMVPNVSPGRILADPKVREALQESINRAQIASTVFSPDYPVVTSILENTTPDYTDESSLLGYDPKAAEALLQSDGWVKGSNGIRQKDGKSLTLIEPITEDTPIVDLLQSQLKIVGIQLQLDLVTLASETSLVDNPGGNYDLAETYLTRGDPSVLASVLDTGIVKTGEAEQSQTPAEAAKVSALFAAGNKAVVPAQRQAVYSELQAYVIKNDIAFPLDERLEVTGVAKDVHGLQVTDEGLIIANNIWLSH